MTRVSQNPISPKKTTLSNSTRNLNPSNSQFLPEKIYSRIEIPQSKYILKPIISNISSYQPTPIARIVLITQTHHQNTHNHHHPLSPSNPKYLKEATLNPPPPSFLSSILSLFYVCSVSALQSVMLFMTSQQRLLIGHSTYNASCGMRGTR